MRILHVLNELNPSGAETMLRVAAPYWRRWGCDSHILSTGISPGPYARALEDVGYKVHHIPSSISFRQLYKIYRLFNQGRYDAIHIHAERLNFWYAMLASSIGAGRIIRTVHNVFYLDKARRLRRIGERWIMRRFLGVQTVSISLSVKENELKAFKNASCLIPNWFDSNLFRPPSEEERRSARENLGVAADTVVFVSIGNCSSVKNHSAIIGALASLPENAPVMWFHVGIEASGYPERALAGTAGVSNCVRFCGTLQDVSPILKAADVYVMPSFYEGCPISLIEAMGVGLAVILADSPGLRDFKDAGPGIYWVMPTSESIHKGLVYFLNTPEHRRRAIGRELSKYAHERFGIERGTREYLNLYTGRGDDAKTRRIWKRLRWLFDGQNLRRANRKLTGD